MNVGAAIILISGIIIFFLVYYYRVKKIDRDVMECDSCRATPANVYMDGVEYFPTNKFVLYGFQFKSIAGLAPIIGAITAGMLWGWLPALIWILVGNIFIGWVQDYFSCMISVRNEGKSFGPLSYELIGPRTRNILMIFLVFYLILIMAAFSSLTAGMLKTSTNSIVPTITVLISGVIVGLLIYRLKLNPFVGTVAGILLIIAGLLVGASYPISIPNVDFWLIAILVICLIAGLTPIWSFTQPTIYMFFYIVFFGLIALVVSIIIGNPTYITPDYTDFFAGLAGSAAMPLWPLLFVTIACGSVSGWHSLVSSSATSKQIENETDIAPVTAGTMLAEGVLALLALSIVATLSADQTKGLSAAQIFSKGASSLLLGSTTAQAYVGLIFIALALAVMMLVIRLGRLTIHEIGGEKIPLLNNKYIASILFLIVTFILASPTFGGTWIYIWVLFGGANQLMSGLSLMIITLWLIDTKKGWTISGIPGIFMIITTIAALGYASYQSLTKGISSNPITLGNIAAGIIGVILIIAAIIMCIDIYRAFMRRITKKLIRN